MDQKVHYHPKDWSTAELMSYMHYEMHWDAERIASKNREEMIDIVSIDEIDKE